MAHKVVRLWATFTLASMDEHGMAGDAKSGSAGGGLSDALRQAVEKTFAATAEPRGRAQGWIGDLSRRGQETRDDLSRRGVEARDVPAAAASRLAEMVEGLGQVKDLEARVSALEADVKRLEQRPCEPDTKPQAKG